jgi:Cellulase N-terminal ig-like domain/Glycosyl hydrolase family 9
LGVNGPIPVIVVDQFGYPTKATKIAVIQNPQVGYGGMAPGDNYAVVDRATGAIVKRGTPVAWDSGATDPVSSDKAWWFDFSDLTAPGTYVTLMQNEDGSLLCVQGLDQASPPSAATGPSYYGPATTAASLMGAAAFAYASKIYSARTGETLRRYGYDLATRAKQAWDWAIANPRVLYYNNDDLKQPGSRGLAAGQQEMDEPERLFAKFQAAVYLYELTGDAIYKSFIESSYASIVPSGDQALWNGERQETLMYYTRLSSISPQVRSAILTKFIASVTGNADQLPMVTDNKDPDQARSRPTCGAVTRRRPDKQDYISFWRCTAVMLLAPPRRILQS